MLVSGRYLYIADNRNILYFADNSVGERLIEQPYVDVEKDIYA